MAILCLPDDAAKDAVALANELPDQGPKIIDASTAHRVAADWTYGFAELIDGQADRIRASRRVTNPGCYSTGALALLRPLVNAGVLPPDYPLTINAVSGYSGGGKSMIAEFESGTAAAFKLYGLGPYAESSKRSASATPISPPVVSVAADGFDWGAAGIGAGVAIGLALLATGMVVVVRQTRRPQLSTPS